MFVKVGSFILRFNCADCNSSEHHRERLLVWMADISVHSVRGSNSPDSGNVSPAQISQVLTTEVYGEGALSPLALDWFKLYT